MLFGNLLLGGRVETCSVSAAGRAAIALGQDGEPLIQSGEDALGNYRETRTDYRDEEGKTSVSLRVRDYGEMSLVWASGAIENGNAFGSQRSFDADGGIVLTTAPLGNVLRYMANYQHKDWWTRPIFGADPAALPARTQSLLWQSDGSDEYRLILPVCGPKVRTELRGSEAGGLQFRLSSRLSGMNRIEETLVFAARAGSDPYRLMERLVGAALDVLEDQTQPRERKRYPEILDHVGWCSWDAFYHKVDEAGLLAKAEEFGRIGLPIRWVMIDDGWSAVNEGKLASFDADPAKFSQGLRHTIDQLKGRHGIQWVGVWHTIAGYWGGIDPESALARQYAGYLAENARGNLLPAPDAGLGFGFWRGWHGYLKRQGVDFVKVDSQSAVTNFWSGLRSVGSAASAAHAALEASVALHYDGAVINCMGMAAENVWHRPMSAVSRSSDDFVPREPRGFAEHALQNAYNSFYHGAFYWGDWDMFWSRNHDNVQNAVLRAVSGGPVYISDAPERTDPAVIWPLIYRDGTIIRCERPGVPTEDCLLRDPVAEQTPLKLWNTAGGAGVVAAFHIGTDAHAVSGSVGPRDVPGLAEAQRYAVYAHFSRQCRIVSADERISFSLEQGKYEIYTIVPMQGAVTMIGLADKYIARHAVLSAETAGRTWRFDLREGGPAVFLADRTPVEVRVQGSAASWKPIGEGAYEADGAGAAGPVRIEVVLTD